MIIFDELAETDGDDEFKAWLSKVIDAKQEIVAFVVSSLTATLKGHSTLVSSSDLVMEDLKPWFVSQNKATRPRLAGMKKNEVQFLTFLSEKTTNPLPRVGSWGTIEYSPQHLGPFIIIDYVDRISLAAFL